MSPLVRILLRLFGYGSVGALLCALLVTVLWLNDKPELKPWHRVQLKEEFRAAQPLQSFAEYLALEDRLYAELDRKVYVRVPIGERRAWMRYATDSQADPRRIPPTISGADPGAPADFNRSRWLEPDAAPKAGALLLHGLTDSPYSLRALGLALRERGVRVLLLRLPGHGTAPGALRHARLEDWRAAVRLAARELRQQLPAEAPLFLLGYSNGAALALDYTLDAQQDPSLPQPARLVLISPALRVSPVADYAGVLLALATVPGLGGLAWDSVLPEYDPYKYNSFPIHAARETARLTESVRTRLLAGTQSAPPTLVFQSVVDDTVRASAVVEDFLPHWPGRGHRLMLYDIDRAAETLPLLEAERAEWALRLVDGADPLPFDVALLTQVDAHGDALHWRERVAGAAGVEALPSALRWPPRLYSLSHIALPFAPQDPVYGSRPAAAQSGRWIFLGTGMPLHGERGLLRVPLGIFIRQRYNPWFDDLLARSIDFLALGSTEALAASGDASLSAAPEPAHANRSR